MGWKAGPYSRINPSATKMASNALLIPETELHSNLDEAFTDSSRGSVTWSTLISSSVTKTDSLCAGIVSCPPWGGTLEAHSHEQAEIYYILSGEGSVTVSDQVYPVKPGSMLYIPGSATHRVQNSGCTELRWLYFFATSDFRSVVYHFQNEGAMPAAQS